MRIYNEKNQDEKVKIENTKFEEKLNGAKSSVQRDKQIKKQSKGIADLRARSHETKLSTCENELKKGLSLGLVVHAFRTSTQETEKANL